MDSDGSSNNISALPDVHLTSGTLPRHDFLLHYLRWKVSRIEFAQGMFGDWFFKRLKPDEEKQESSPSNFTV